MKINSINLNNTYKQNFKGRREIQQRAQGFADDIVEFTHEQKNLPKYKLDNIVRSYLPFLVIRHSKDNHGNGIVCDPYYNFRYTDKTCYLRSQTLHIPKIHFNPQLSEKAEFVDNIVHEMTHAFQNVDEETSFVTRYNNYLKNNSLEQLHIAGSVSRDLFEFLETKAVYPRIDDLYVKAVEKDLNNIETPKALLDRVLPTVEDDFEELVQDKLLPLKSKASVADVDFIVQDIVDALTSEEDAYRAGFSASKKFKRQNYIVINDAIPELYQSLAKVVTNKF